MNESALPQVRLGQLLREIRQGHRYSISDVSEQTGISSSFLSLVETGKSDISFGRLMRLTDFYRVSLGDLFPARSDSDITVTRRTDRFTTPGRTLELLASADPAAITTFVAGCERDATVAEPIQRHGEAFVYVIEGTVAIEVGTDGAAVVLEAGDSAYVSAPKRTYRNIGDGTATMLGVLLKPS